MPARAFTASTLAALLAAPVARAHYPHDVAYWAAISPDPATPRIATSLERLDLDLIGRSEDGRAWAARLVGATRDGEVVSGAFLTSERLVLAHRGWGLLVSEDAGDTLAPEPTVTDRAPTRVVASPAVLEDGLAFACGESSVWRTGDAGLSWEPVLTGAGFIDLDLSPDFPEDGRLCALEADQVACSADFGEIWTRAPAPPDPWRLSVGAAGRVWAVSRSQGLSLSRDEGQTWAPHEFEGWDLTVVEELPGDLVLLTRAREAAWRSTDAGQTWDTVDVLDVTLQQSPDGNYFFGVSQGPDGRIYLATWYGLAISEDGGERFTFFDTEPIQNTHSVALTRLDGGGLGAWVGTYGGGPLLVDLADLGTRTFPSLTHRFTRTTPVTDDWGRDGTAVFDEGVRTYRTTDHGQTWEVIATDPKHDDGVALEDDVKGVALSPDSSLDPVVLTTNGQAAMTFKLSEDLGNTWIEGAQRPPCEGAGLAVALSPRWPAEPRAWAACGGLVYESVDRGRAWEVLGDTGASFVFGLAERADGAVLAATSAGLWRLDGDGAARIGFADELVVGVTAAAAEGDATVFALVPAEGWLRSEDGGERWRRLAAPTLDVPRMIALSPTFSEDGTLAVAAHGGAWASTDRGETWFDIYTLEVYETSHDAWHTAGTWLRVPQASASSGEIMVNEEEGASMYLDFQGIALTLEAPVDGAEGAVAVTLDGAELVEVALPPPDGIVWRAEGLDRGWHRLEVEVLEGSVALDCARITRLAPLEPGPGDTAAGDGGCSCGDGGVRGALLLPLARTMARRRRGAALLPLLALLAACTPAPEADDTGSGVCQAAPDEDDRPEDAGVLPSIDAGAAHPSLDGADVDWYRKGFYDQEWWSVTARGSARNPR
ncbi:MAG: sialidase family protein [Pseudomonadota bacterium]